jgi:hypothetical protein
MALVKSWSMVDLNCMLSGHPFNDEATQSTARPAVVDGEVVWLPTLAGLLRGDRSVAPAPRLELWAALAAAMVSDDAFEHLDRELADGRDLADVIDIEAWRQRRH